MEITQALIEAVEARFTGDFKQDLYVKLLELEGELPQFETIIDLHKWLSSLAMNQYGNNAWKDHNRDRLMEENDSDIRNLYGYDDAVADPLDIVLAAELEEEILSGLSDLELDIYGRYNKGQGYQEIAWDLKMKEAAVRKHMSRIKGKFNGKKN